MHDATWFARGLLFENCNCQLICPAHISFKNFCTHARCHGHWAIHVADGRFGDVGLDGVNVVIVFESPQQMYAGGWTQVFYIDERADAAQRNALETIFSGRAGGPWAILARFVSRQLETRFVPMQFEDDGRRKRLTIPGYFDTTVSAIRAVDGQGEAVLSNLFNQIHGPVHVLARGRTRCTDRDFDFSNEKTHGLYSQFAWEAGA